MQERCQQVERKLGANPDGRLYLSEVRCFQPVPGTRLAAGMCSQLHHLGGKVERRLPSPCRETARCHPAGKPMGLPSWRDAGLPLQPAGQRRPWARAHARPPPGFLRLGVSKVKVHKPQAWEPGNEAQEATGSFRCVES